MRVEYTMYVEALTPDFCKRMGGRTRDGHVEPPKLTYVGRPLHDKYGSD